MQGSAICCILVVIAEVQLQAGGWHPVCQYPITVERVIDGDTIVADIDLGFGVTLDDRVIRCAGYDAWEVSRRRRTVTVTDEEIRKGKQVAKELRDLLADEETIAIYVEPTKERGIYGRIEAAVYVVRRVGDGYVTLDIAAGARKNGWVRQ